MKKKKWSFLFEKAWDLYDNGFSVELFTLHFQKDFICIIIFGLSFIWEK